MTDEQVQVMRDSQLATILYQLATCDEDHRPYWERMRDKLQAQRQELRDA